MPIKFTATAGGDDYGSPFVGPIDHVATINVNITALTTREVDSKGYLKPGVPLEKDGSLVGAAEFVFGVTIEPLKVAAGNDATSLAAASAAHPVPVATIGQVNQDIAEDNLGAVYTAAEIAGFDLAGSKLVLL